MKNTTELRQELEILYTDLKTNKIDVKKAKIMVTASNSMLKSASLEMEHSKMIKDRREIKFLSTPLFGRKTA